MKDRFKDRETCRPPLGRYPGLRLAGLLSTGILFASRVGLPLDVLLVVFMLLAAFWAGSEIRGTGASSTALYLILIPVCGALLTAVHQEKQRFLAKKADHLALFAGEETNLRGKILSRSRTAAGRERFDVLAEQTLFATGESWNHAWKVRLYGAPCEVPVPGSSLPATDSNASVGETQKDPPVINHDLQPLCQGSAGDRVHAAIRLYRPGSPGNPGEADYALFLKKEGIYLQGELLEWHDVRKGETGGWHSRRAGIHDRLDRLFDADTAPLARALLTGDKSGLEARRREQFERSGLSHIMAVSGLHAGFVTAPFWLLFPWLRLWRWGERAGLLCLAITLWCFAGLAGFSASVGRAGLMAWFLSAGRVLGKERASLNMAGISAVVLLLINPYQLFDASFQLSYGAIFTILLALPYLRRILPASIRYSRGGGFLMILLISVTVQLGLLPILIAYFGEISLAGPLANAMVIPLLGLLVPGLFLLLFLMDLSPRITFALKVPAEYGLAWINQTAGFFGDSDLSWISIGEASYWLFGFWAVSAGLIASLNYPSIRIKAVILILLMLCVFFSARLSEQLKPARLRVVMLDVGQGDAIHIATPAGRNLLVDSGRWSFRGYNSGDRTLLPYLESKGVDRLDAVILSHPHSDHIGGMVSLIQHMQIDSIFHSGYEHDTNLYRRYRQQAEVKGVGMRTVTTGDLIEIDPSLRLFVLGPEPGLHASSPNNRSVILKMVYNNTHFLFPGDAEEEQEERLTRHYDDFLESQFLKVGHHGSRTSSGNRFLKAVRPDLAAVSLSFDNSFNHPHPRAIGRIGRYTDKIYYTSLEGGLVFASDGKKIRKLE